MFVCVCFFLYIYIYIFKGNEGERKGNLHTFIFKKIEYYLFQKKKKREHKKKGKWGKNRGLVSR